jgi:hypothetical protein
MTALTVCKAEISIRHAVIESKEAKSPQTVVDSNNDHIAS